MRRLLTVAVLTGCGSPAAAPNALPEPTVALRPVEARGTVPAEARVADYRIEARLDAEAHTVEGTVHATFHNRTERSTKVVPLHLYMNAFRAQDTTWMKAGRGSHRGRKFTGEWGYVDVRTAKLADGTELKFSEGPEDPSVGRIELPTALGPGQALDLTLEFKTQLPRVFARTGHGGDRFHMVAQWFPKLGVLEEAAGWQAHVFHRHSEFYADFGNYEVRLNVPADLTVGASGIRTDEQTEGDRKSLTYLAEMVHDFAWTTSPEFVEYAKAHDGIRIRQLIQPAKAADADGHFDAQVAALDSMQKRFGPYPWSTITIVHPPRHASGAGGMEYPTLYSTFDRSDNLAIDWLYEDRRSGWWVTVHEFGHQYFQGLLASNEFAQPWVDEGMNTMSNHLVYEDWFGEDPWIYRVGPHTLRASDMIRRAIRGPVDRVPVDSRADEFDTFVGGYNHTVYRKTAAAMLTLRNLVGHEGFDAAMRVYADRYRFRHPTGEDLFATLIEQLGARVPLGEGVHLDVRRYLDQAFEGTERIDFEVTHTQNRRAAGLAGWHRDDAGELMETPLPDAPVPRDEGNVVIYRRGGFVVPVEVKVVFEDGGAETRMWDANSRYVHWTFPGKPVRYAVIDPQHKLVLEGRRVGNVGYAHRDPRAGDAAALISDATTVLAQSAVWGASLL